MEQELVRLGELPEAIYSYQIIDNYLEPQQPQEKNSAADLSKEEEVTIQQHRAFLDLEENEWSRNLTTILLSVGASETKQFFILLNRYFLSSKYRLQIVYLLSEFIRKRYDNSTTLIAISVTNMIMLLPRMSTSLPPFLPQLFYIFARAICWDQLRDLRKKQSFEAMSNKTQTTADGWDCEKNFALPEEFDEETFKTRTIPQVSRHLLHPNLVLMDAQTELTDKTRWMKMEPPDVIAQIMALDLTNAASRVAFSTSYNNAKEQHLQRDKEVDLLDESVLQDTVEKKDDETQQQQKKEGDNIVTLHKALKSGTEVLIGEDIWDASSEPTLTVTTPTSANVNTSSAFSTPTLPQPYDAPSSSTEDDMSSTQTKLHFAALKRELNFELFLKQQHLQHIGRLHRDHVLDTSVEAERQQLYNTNRMLKAQLHQTTAALEKLKSESAMTKQKHIKWEDEQSGKLRGYREARKEWQNQMAVKQHQVYDYEKQLDEQRRQLDKARERIFELENELKTLEPTLAQVAGNEHRVQQLTKQMLLWEEDTAHMEEQKAYIKGLLSKWWSMEELVASLQTQNSRLQEERAQSEETMAKLKVQCMDYQHQVDNFSKSFNTEKVSTDTDKLNQSLNELKQKIEALEIEKLELTAEIETLKFAIKGGSSIESSSKIQQTEAITAE
ncbi:hypothetical protein BDF20DRAFT_903993 [Mycotypha africana]|uniref:uncharacterized protein n=1 Tax=Mycotypha africana TaxID=64632 RepID=UPI0023003B44|nr:uncharacterized protein BDF20DRAFT_903993 [Mycotypha africana]KAI8991218.1 hypothetical protein BDF20DRAFT_903993 [Mycotypha africana]